MTWQATTLGEHVEIVSGPAFKSAHFTEDGQDVPLVKGENIAQGYIAWDKSRYWSRGELDGLDRFWLVPGDIVLAMDRPWVPAGLKWAEIQPHDPRSLLVQRVARIRATGTLEQRFLKQVIRSRAFSQYIQGLMYGVNVPHISGGQIRAFRFLLPDETTQRRVLELLSTYDDLIENNRRRIALLEDAARLLYREWFVRFRFPGREHAKATNNVPEGWDLKRLGDVADTNPESHTASGLPDVLNYVDISSVETGRIIAKTTVSSHDAPGRARRIARDGDVLWSNVRPNLKAYSLVLNPAPNDVFSTGFTILRAKSVPFSYLYYLVTTDAFVGHLVNYATGAGYPAVRPDDFERAEVLVPPADLLESFHAFVLPIIRQRERLEALSKELAAARDLLLPRLMDGRIAV